MFSDISFKTSSEWFYLKISLNFLTIFFHFQCIQITQRLEKISASKEEYYLLKALTLSNCDIRLDNYEALKKLRESILGALNDCVLILRWVIEILRFIQLNLTDLPRPSPQTLQRCRTPTKAVAAVTIAPTSRSHHPPILDEGPQRGQHYHEQVICRDARVVFAISLQKKAEVLFKALFRTLL